MPASAVSESTWTRLGEVVPSTLTDARLQLHHAAQIAVSAAISYLAARPDDSHTALTWSATNRALLTEPITAARPFRIGLRLENLTLHGLDESHAVTASFALSGRTAAEAHAWLGEVAAAAGLDAGALTSRKHYTIPEHLVANGAPFSIETASHFQELAKYWSNASSFLEELARATRGASDVRTWPHHFDVATLVALPGPNQRTIGVGQSPGDDSYAEPYWYVGPRPYPDSRDLPSLEGGGHWHTTGWFGAALPASDFVQAPDQRARVAAFVESALAACRRLLGS